MNALTKVLWTLTICYELVQIKKHALFKWTQMNHSYGLELSNKTLT